MRSKLRLAVIGFVLCFATTSLNAGTVIKLSLGETTPDVSLTQAGLFGTTDDGNAGTTGNQNTAIEYTNGLDFIPDIPTNIGSFTLAGLQANGLAQVIGTLAIQNFSGGVFNLFDPANVLLLSGTLSSSALTAVVGPPGTGSVFSTGPITIGGGTLAPLFAPGSVSLSLTLTNINDGAGLGVGAAAPILQPFTADSTLAIAATVVPEPTTLALVLIGGAAGTKALARRRNKRL